MLSFLTRIGGFASSRPGIVNKPPDIIIWGVDVAELTSLVYTLKNGRYIQGSLSAYPFSEKITTGKATFIATVPSGNEAGRRSFRHLLPKFDGIVYLVDTTIDPESKAELDDILADKAISKPILVLVPKPDASGIANEETLVQELGMGEAIAKANGRVALFPYSLSSAQLKGYDEGFRWLFEQLIVAK